MPTRAHNLNDYCQIEDDIQHKRHFEVRLHPDFEPITLEDTNRSMEFIIQRLKQLQKDSHELSA